jgi:DNA-binding NtrC family response regulator
MKMLMSYRWPGNVRELENTMERAILLAGSEELGESDFPMLTLSTAKPATKTVKKK